MPEQRAKESAKRKDRRHEADTRDEAIAAAAAQQQVTNARVVVATREALCMLGLNPSQHGLFNAFVPGFHVYPQASRLSGGVLSRGECGHAFHAPPATIDLNTTLVSAGSLAGGARKRTRRMPADQLPGARNLFDGMPAANDSTTCRT
ncbi:DNA repair protein rhp54 [Hordeum vulgare]|nr:DNA repair protein rhp54 [Hordeum vulgare]